MLLLLFAIPAAGAAEAAANAAEVTAKFSGKKSVWHGFERFDFTVDGRSCIVVTPKAAAEGRPFPVRSSGDEYLRAARKYLADYPDSPYRDVTLFRIALVERNLRRPKQSLAAVKALKANHPDSCHIRQVVEWERQEAEWKRRAEERKRRKAAEDAKDRGA